VPAIRLAGDWDLDGVREIARGYDGLTHWPDRPDYLDHERDTGRLLVAVDDARVVGFGGALSRDRVTHLGDLFIRPERLGEGIGRALLDQLFAGAQARTTSASGDPRAIPLYIRFGMRPLWPVLYLEGTNDAARRVPAEDVGLRLATVDAVADLDRPCSARFRPQDFRFLSGAGASLYAASSIPSGYGCLRTVKVGSRLEAFVAPIGAASEPEAARMLLALVGRAAENADVVHVPPLGPHPAVPALIAAGFRLSDRDTFMSSDLSLVDPCRYVPSPEVG
jgi:GNAT superfamily N-acetyltransferase